jgi:hypothetical protein
MVILNDLHLRIFNFRCICLPFRGYTRIYLNGHFSVNTLALVMAYYFTIAYDLCCFECPRQLNDFGVFSWSSKTYF